jgi:hypothetical protein
MTRGFMALLSAFLVAAVVAPMASAAGPEWSQEGAPMLEEQEVGLSGDVKWSKLVWFSSFGCEVDVDLNLHPGSGATLDNFTFDNCSGTGVFNGCEAKGSSLTSLSGQAQSNGIATGTDDLWLYLEDCPTGQKELFIDDFGLNLQADNPAAFSTLKQGKSGPNETSAEFAVDPAGVFGVFEQEEG